MSPIRDLVETDHGGTIFVITKQWRGIFPNGHTGLCPTDEASIQESGRMIYWRTTDADLLRVIHAKLIIAIRARGLNELKYVVNLERDQPGLGATMLRDILGDELCGLVKSIS